MNLPASVWAELKRAMEGARVRAGGSMSDTDSLEAIARDALAHQTQDGAPDPRRMVVIYECAECKRSELATGAGAVELPPEQSASLACGASVCDLRTEAMDIVMRGGPTPSALERAVLLRDRNQCRGPGCGRRIYVHVHHLVERSKGGEHSRRNCITLCSTCHLALHEGKLRVEGDAEAGLRWFDAKGNEMVDRSAAPQLGHGENENASLTPAARKILETMGDRGGWSLDQLVDESGLGAPEVLVGITHLEIARAVVREHPGVFRKVSRGPAFGSESEVERPVRRRMACHSRRRADFEGAWPARTGECSGAFG
jgi:hypothetical protein